MTGSNDVYVVKKDGKGKELLLPAIKDCIKNVDLENGVMTCLLYTSISKELGILTVGVVTKPFNFEGKKRMSNAEKGIAELKKNVDTRCV